MLDLSLNFLVIGLCLGFVVGISIMYAAAKKIGKNEAIKWLNKKDHSLWRNK